MVKSFTIKDLEKLSGVKAHTLRIWEFRYALIKPQRTLGNFRLYTLKDVKTILNIALLNQNGFVISRLVKMDEDTINYHLKHLNEESSIQRMIINELLVSMYAMDVLEFEMVLNRCCKIWDMDKVIRDIIMPFLELAGISWGMNQNSEEYFAVAAIRSKLIMGIEHIPQTENTGRSALLFLPECRHHDLMLLYMQYLLKIKGLHTLLMGANVSIQSLKKAGKIKKPDFFFTYLPSKHNFAVEDFLSFLNEELPGSVLVMPESKVTRDLSITGDNLIIADYHRVPDFLYALKRPVLSGVVNEQYTY